MSQSFLVYAIIAMAFAAIDFWFAWRAFKKREKLGRAMGLSAVFAGVTTLSYLISLVWRSPLATSLFSSVYFAGIDWTLLSLVWFTFLITGMGEDYSLKSMRDISIFAALDTGVLLVNVFTGVAVTYQHLEPVGITYHMNALYVLHLVFTYLLVIDIVTLLILKAVRTPRQYRSQFLVIMAAVFVVVGINALFLFPDSESFFTKVDCSVLGYSLGLYLMYWAAFDYRSNDMLRDLSLTIFENIDQGIVLFDYAEKLFMFNRRAGEMLKGVALKAGMPQAEFIERCGIAPGGGDQFAVQCDPAQGQPLRCDYSRLRGKKNSVIGNLFVFTDITQNTDITSGFVYARDIGYDDYKFEGDAAVAIFDITGLREINRTLGREAGDRRIRALAKLMRAHMPPESIFLRGYEANLVAICPRATERDIAANVEKVLAESENLVICGISDTAPDPHGGAAMTLAQAVETARHAIQVKKLLSHDSVRSQTLNSLVRALEEADQDTEAHVRRTQRIGAMLGERIGLKDAQLADLRLLCLLHDIGKIGIPLDILNKPGRLSDQEWAVLRTHPDKGYQIAMATDEMKNIADMILSHHERWDGTGYPQKLAGDDIPVLSRIISIVDAYDAMVNDRAYRKAMTPQAAQAEIRDNAGTQFDPEIARAFLDMLAENPDLAAGEKVGGQAQRPQAVPAPQPAGEGVTAAISFSRYILNSDNVIIETDAQFETITGYSAADAVGKMTQFDLIPAEDRAHYMIMVSNQQAKGSIIYLRHDIQRKDGGKVRVACCGKKYFDSATKTFQFEIIIFAE